MFDEPGEQPPERPQDPAARARDKTDGFRMHAELAAVFEGRRKFNAEIMPDLNADIARDVQKTIARLEKSRAPDSPILLPPSAAEALVVLKQPELHGLSTNDYHIYRRPGEAMIARWLEGDLVDGFYERLQAHFDAAMAQFREEERREQGWKQEAATQAYLDEMDKLDIKMADRYLREVIRKHKVCVLSTQSADELDILYLCDYVMGADAAEVVGPASAPPEEPTERDRAWFFKLFSLRGIDEGVERMCFFTYLQKSDETDGW